MEWWSKMMIPIRKGWIRVAKRLGLRKTGKQGTREWKTKIILTSATGLVKLRQDVRTCEYEDVHILWEMLKRNQSGVTQSATRSGRRHFSSIVELARRAPLLCHHGV